MRKTLEPSTAARLTVMFIAAFWALMGCGKATEQPADPQPFKAAIAEYLERGNMAMALKEIKEGPAISGNSARLKASLTHAQMPGPSVTWVFLFERGSDGRWKVVQHES